VQNGAALAGVVLAGGAAGTCYRVLYNPFAVAKAELLAMALQAEAAAAAAARSERGRERVTVLRPQAAHAVTTTTVGAYRVFRTAPAPSYRVLFTNTQPLRPPQVAAARAAAASPSMRRAAGRVWARGGANAFFAGVGAASVRAFVPAGVGFAMFEWLKAWTGEAAGGGGGGGGEPDSGLCRQQCRCSGGGGSSVGVVAGAGAGAGPGQGGGSGGESGESGSGSSKSVGGELAATMVTDGVATSGAGGGGGISGSYRMIGLASLSQNRQH
jgi:hypothetical protein